MEVFFNNAFDLQDLWAGRIIYVTPVRLIVCPVSPEELAVEDMVDRKHVDLRSLDDHRKMAS